MHERVVLHRDLKPENLLLTSSISLGAAALPLVKVADFGFATAAPTAGSAPLSALVGTWAYSAPEMRDAARPGYGAPIDAWALGIISYILLAGYHPFDPTGAAPQADILSAIARADFDFDDAAWAGVSVHAKDCVRALLARDPAARATPADALATPWMRGMGGESRAPISEHIADDIMRYRKAMKSRLRTSVFVAVAVVRLFSGHAAHSRRAALAGAILKTAAEIDAAKAAAAAFPGAQGAAAFAPCAPRARAKPALGDAAPPPRTAPTPPLAALLLAEAELDKWSLLGGVRAPPPAQKRHGGSAGSDAPLPLSAVGEGAEGAEYALTPLSTDGAGAAGSSRSDVVPAPIEAQ